MIKINDIEYKELIKIDDPGHGWLRVPRHLIVRANIAHEISGFSYIDNVYVYLEEDCDAALFLDKVDYESLGFNTVAMLINHIDTLYQDPTFVRDLPGYSLVKLNSKELIHE